MSVLISGAGLIGAHAARVLRDAGRRILLYDAACADYVDAVMGDEHPPVVTGEVCDVPKLAETMRDHGVTTLVHTAGLIGATVLRDPYRGIEANVLGTMAAVEAARLAEVRRFVFCSSMAVYDFDRLPSGAISRIGASGFALSMARSTRSSSGASERVFSTVRRSPSTSFAPGTMRTRCVFASPPRIAR